MRDAFPEVRLRAREQSVFTSHGDTVLGTSRNGMIDGAPEHGLYVRQTRLLSHYQITLAGIRPLLAAGSNARQDRWDGYLLVAPPEDGKRTWRNDPQTVSQHTVELRLGRIVGDGMHEDLDVTNYSGQPVRLALVLEVDGDFADPEETKSGRKQRGTLARSWRRDADGTHVLRLDYRAGHQGQHHGRRTHARLHRALEMRITRADSPPRRNGRRIAFEVALGPRAHWHACIEWRAEMEGEPLSLPECPLRSGYAEIDRTEAPFLKEATRFSTFESASVAGSVVETLEQARHDLHALRLQRLDLGPRAWTVAAGVPMYVGLFGRDTLIAGWHAGIAGSEVLRGTLPRLAALQGTRNDPWRDEQPGRILHEAHEGPLAVLQLHPKGRYYGSLTSSALFPFCIAQLWAWTGDREAVAPLLDAGRAALAWLDRVACDARGFHAYRTRSRQGLDNQTWKDSQDGVPDEDGRTVRQPVASCEEQATVFAAKVAFAEVLWAFGHKAEARRLHRAALELRKRFNAAYWLEDAGFYAMALDPRGRPVRSIGSNALHCLASGIADETLAGRVIERLFAPELFSGWGVRTLSTQHPAYNPYAYHRGAVWPAEQGSLALAACRGGWHERVQEIARAVFDAASIFDSNRLPECFSGHPRDAAHPFPSLYPAANAPQAWSATTPLMLVQAMLGLQPYAPAGLLLVDPHLPEWLPRLCLHGLRVGAAVVDLEFLRTPDGDSSFRVLHQSGPLQVKRQAVPWTLALAFGDGLRAQLGV